MTSPANEERLLIGACGWQHEAWSGSFYPEDLPPDWQLTYYANEFRVVLVPADHWARPDLDPGAWPHDTDAGFRFVCEVPDALLAGTGDSALHETFMRALRHLGSRCTAALLHLPPTPVDPARLEGLLAELHPYTRLSHAGPVPDPLADMLERFGVGRCWEVGQAPPALSPARPALARLSGNPDLPTLRRVIETCLGAAGDRGPAILLFDGDPPSPNTMRQAIVIRDLL